MTRSQRHKVYIQGVASDGYRPIIEEPEELGSTPEQLPLGPTPYDTVLIKKTATGGFFVMAKDADSKAA